MELMTEIKEDKRLPEDARATIKNLKMGNTWRKRLMDEWQLTYMYKSIDESIIKTINKRCAGNPMLCLHYFLILLQKNEILIA